MNSDSTLIVVPSVPHRPPSPERAETAARVAAIISRRARVAGLSDAAYFGEIRAGRAPRVTRAEAATEPVTRPPAVADTQI